jgi:hypothetical protein
MGLAAQSEPCECLRKILRATESGRAHCSRHKLFAEKVAGVLRVSRIPFPTDLAGTLHLRRREPLV